MANKRQRLNRRKPVQTDNEESAPASSASTAPTMRIKGKPRKISMKKVSKSSRPKIHPLRVPGYKPGEGCFICKSADHVAKACPQKAEKDRKKICLLCRESGHVLKNCPLQDRKHEGKFCYNCGESGHRLAQCDKPLKDGGTAFAECFLCKAKGHLSRNCPSNIHGIYPKGGECKICGGVTHLAKDCPEKPSQSKVHFLKKAEPSKYNAQSTVFRSGDDLEDDFVGIAENRTSSVKNKGKLRSKGTFKRIAKQSFLKPFVKQAKSPPKIC